MSTMHSTSLCVLVVDDDEVTRRMIADALVAEGYTVRAAASGAEAIRSVRRRRPDLILLDVHMPGVDGWQVLEELRSAAGPQTPVVVMTAGYLAQDRALSSGAQGYLGKPFEVQDLVEAVQAHAGLPLQGGTEEIRREISAP
jgi:two-component system OmpR family response regulator